MAKLRGSGIVNNLKLYREELGEERLRELVAPLPDETRALLDRMVLPVEWIEVDTWMAIHDVVLRRHFAGDERTFRKLVRRACELDFSTFYRVLIRLASPAYVLERTATLWSTYNDSGELKVVARDQSGERSRAVLRLDAYETRYAVYGVVLHGYVEQLLAMTGAREIEVVRPVNRAGPRGLDCELHATYLG